MFVTELRGNPQVFNLKDGSTLRLAPHESEVRVKDSKVSDELRLGEKMGLVLLSEEPKVSPQVSATKTGGVK